MANVTGRRTAGTDGPEDRMPLSVETPNAINDNASKCAGWIMCALRHAACLHVDVIDANPRLARLIGIPGALWNAVTSWIADGGPRLGAAVAFYSIFALAPLLIVATAIASAVFGADEVRGQFTAQMGGLIGEEPAQSLERMIASAWKPRSGALAGAIGVATLLAGATGVLVELRNALNAMLHIEGRQGSVVGAFLRARLAALALVLGFGFLLIVSLMLSALLAAVSGWLPGRFPEFKVLLALLDLAVSIGVLSVAFAAIVRWLPSEAPPWRLVWISALGSALLFTVGKYLVGIYLARAAFVSAYGAAGSLAVILVWIYFTSQLMLLAVAFARQFGPSAPVAKPAQRITSRPAF
jgi:membrane protein